MSIKALVRRMVPTAIYGKMAAKKQAWKHEFRVQLTRWCYWRIRRRIRSKVKRGEKIRVLFLETEIAKWKTQSLFELMKASPFFEPMMGISRRDRSDKATTKEISDDIQKTVQYYEAKGNRCVVVYDAEKKLYVDLRQFNPDIVFYQQTWYLDGNTQCCQAPLQASRHSLLAYVPYYVMNYGDLNLDAKMELHRLVAYYFLLNGEWVNALSSWAPWWYYVGRMLPTGHTMLDYQYLHQAKTPTKQCVVYAPHFSFSMSKNDSMTKISTFPWSGRPLLEYARKHPEMNWVFKPHPVLYRWLIDSGLWTKAETDAYYDSWAGIGRVCTDGDYLQLFDEATAMITDCGSFLTEFGSTGKPVIHLISADATLHPMKPSKELYATYYDVHSLNEMYQTFATVLEKQEDPKKEERQAAVAQANLTGQYAAQNIMNVFKKDFCIKE